MLVDKNFPIGSGMPVLHVHDIEGTVLAPIQAALEDLLVPNKFADEFACNHKIQEEAVDRDRLACVTPRSLLRIGYEGFQVEHGNGRV